VCIGVWSVENCFAALSNYCPEKCESLLSILLLAAGRGVKSSSEG
jgi:hypothetical protein